MESNNKKKIINIPTGNPTIVEELVNDFNSRYKVEFKYLGSEDRDGVEFALVERGASISLDEVFLLGFFYGGKVRQLRDSKKIDW